MRYRAHARVLARRRQPQPWLPWLMLLLAVTLAVALLGAAHAATTDTQATAPKVPLHKQPPAAGVTKAAPGVLKPKKNPDVGMVLPAPNPKQFPMPVIKPPAVAGSAAGTAGKAAPK